MDNWLLLLLYSLLGSVVGLSGGILFLFNKRLGVFLERYAISFASGVLITVSLMGVLPEAVSNGGERMFSFVLLAFLGSYLFEHFLMSIHHHDEHKHGGKDCRGSVGLVLVGDTIHNFVDGVAIGVSFVVDPRLGLIMAFSTMLHELPHEISDFGILLKAGWSKVNVLLVNVVSALATVVGAFVFVPFAGNSFLVGTLLAVSAGIFLYLGTADFLPQIDAVGKHEGRWRVVSPVLLGAGVIALFILFLPSV